MSGIDDKSVRGVGGRMARAIVALPRPTKQLVAVVGDGGCIALSIWAAYLLRFEDPFSVWMQQAAWIFPLAILITVVTLAAFGFYRSVLRHMTSDIFIRLVAVLTLSAMILVTVW
ncbi:MAG: hypothetical protein QF471_04005, partial [Phycisphaerales bacterium]|nr:hypothetical protein [Phycisphaerales bacterium]